MEIITDKDLIYFLNKSDKQKEEIQKIVDSLLFKLVWFRKFKNIPINDYLDNVRKEYQWKKFKKEYEYWKFRIIFNKTKLSITILIYNKKNLIEYEILNKLSNNILTNQNQRHIGSKADYYNVLNLLFQDISFFINWKK